MTSIKRFSTKALAMLIAIIMVVSLIPMSVLAAPASDLPKNMVDHAILRALEYTGYDVQKQKDDGTLYQTGSYGSRTPASVLSGINYGTSTSGKETVADSSTVTGRAPDIATFKSKGLCCASFVTYFVCNYLPNIEGANTQFITDAINATGMNSQAVVTWQTALNKLANEGKIEKICTSSSNVDRTKLAPGDLIIFGNDENSHSHIAVFSGTYNGTDFLIHVGNDRGPEIMPVRWMSDSSNGNKASYPNGYYHLPAAFYEDDGYIEVNKKNTDGNNLAGAVFTATEKTSGKEYVLGPTNSSGYAKVTVPYGTYTIKETTFPTNYRAYGTSSWTATINSSLPNGTYTFNAVNELIPGNCKIVKTSEDGKVDGIDFTITGNGVNKTVTTANGGQITVKDLKPGTYTVTEESISKYEPQDSKSVTVVSGQTATVNFSNTLKRGNLKVTKTSEDGLVEGMQFKLTGTSLSGETIEQYAVTNAKGVATFSDVLISGNVKYTLSEVNTAARYEVPASQSVAIEWNKTTEASVYNKLKRGDLKITKTSEDGMVEGIKFRLTGTSLSGEKIDLTATTNSSGIATFSNVLITGHSTYTVTEVDTKDYYITPAAQSVSIAWKEVTNKSFYNELKRGDLRVVKTSEDGLVEGMKFRLTGTSDSGIKVDETTYTDANGVAVFEDILIGKNYTLQEVNTPTRYVIPANQTLNIEWNNVTGASVENILKKWRADVFKVDGYLYWGNPNEDNGLVPMVMSLDKSSDEMVNEFGWPYGETQGDATLEGAVYGVYKNGDLVDTYTTDKNGWFITKYYPCGDNNEWTIREISASEGYLIDPTVYYVDAHPGNYTVELNTEYIDVYEAIIRGKIALIKHADDGSTQIEHPEENAVFEVFLKSAGSYENARETERALLETDEYGFAETPDWLPYGVYTVKQIKGLEGKEFMPPFDVRINEDGKTYRYLINNATFEAEIEIVKKDAETGKIIPASGIGFKVRNTDTGEYVIQHINYPTPMDIEIYYTDTTGKFMLPYALPYGNYEIIEQNTCFGYVLDSSPVAFKVDGSTDLVTVVKKNYAQKGTITISKFGEVFSSVTEKDGIYQPVYEIKGLEGAVYEVIATEDVITLDGTVRYTKGQVVATVTTGKDGTATTEPLYLGKYEIREVKAPYGMIINKESVNVELVYAGEHVEITSTSASFTNERQKIVIDLKKTMLNREITADEIDLPDDVENEQESEADEPVEAPPLTEYEKLKLQAASGNKWSQYGLAKLLLDNQREFYDPTEAIEWLMESAKNGYTVAKYKLGKMFLKGEHIEKNVDYALRWLEDAVRDRNHYAEYLLGKTYLKGEDVDQDNEYAFNLLRSSAMRGNIYANYTLGKELIDGINIPADVENGVGYVKLSADKGFPPAQYLLGKLLYKGEYVPRDIEKALRYLESAAEQENAYASYLAGKIRITEDAFKDVNKAIYYFKIAAKQGNDYAEYQLGKIYLYGNGVEKDYDKAMEYLHSAADKGNIYAEQLIHSIESNRNWSTAIATLNLFYHLSRMLKDNVEDECGGRKIDRKLKRAIDQKKQALGIRIS